MDSFYDVPRRAPVPTPIEKFSPTPIVPEVSMICPVKGNTNYNSSNIQRCHLTNTNVLRNHNVKIQSSTILSKKQVRFEGPISEVNPTVPSSLAAMKKRIFGQSSKTCEEGSRDTKPPNINSFEQMYMANIPNRQLDLSIIDLPRVNAQNGHSSKQIDKKSELRDIENREHNIEDVKQRQVVQRTDLEDKSDSDKENSTNILPKTYHEFLKTQKEVKESKKGHLDGSVTDLYNYKGTSSLPSDHILKDKFNIINNNDRVNVYNKYINYAQNSHGCRENLNLSPRNSDVDKSKVNTHLEKNLVQSLGDNYNGSVQLVDQIKSNLNEGQRHDLIQPNLQRSWPDSNTIKKMEEKSQKELYGMRVDQPASPRCRCPCESQNLLCKNKSEYGSQVSVNSSNGSSEIVREQPQNDEPSNKELLKIISQQNEQLLLLQKQVAILLAREQDTTKAIREPPVRSQCIGERIVSSTQTEHYHQQVYTPKKRGLSKFSIDMMTSFEVAIRPSLHNKNHISKIQEITETESTAEPNEQSLKLDEPFKIQEDCPSPEPSVNIEMQEYDSSDEDFAPEVGVTFYKNLMGQVNNILRKAHQKSKGNIGEPTKTNDQTKTMERIKEATLKHLRNIGVTINDVDSASDSNSSTGSDNSKNYSPADVSFAVKQVLMKYLPDDQLVQLAGACNNMNASPKVAPVNDKDVDLLPLRPEFSIASIEYMKKYNLIPPSGDNVAPSAVPKTNLQQNQNRILDITALKQQPKLL